MAWPPRHFRRATNTPPIELDYASECECGSSTSKVAHKIVRKKRAKESCERCTKSPCRDIFKCQKSREMMLSSCESSLLKCCAVNLTLRFKGGGPSEILRGADKQGQSPSAGNSGLPTGKFSGKSKILGKQN